MTTIRRQRPAIWCAVIVCAYGVLAPAATIALGDTDSIARDALQWQPTEWAVSHPGDVVNPFDVQAQVVFEHGESGERRVTEMFTTGGDEWRFRFTGTRPGLWTYRSESDVDALNGVAGSIRVEPNPHGIGFVTHVGSKWARESAWTAVSKRSSRSTSCTTRRTPTTTTRRRSTETFKRRSA